MNAYLARGTVAALVTRLEELALRAGESHDAVDLYHMAQAEGALEIALQEFEKAVRAEQAQVAA